MSFNLVIERLLISGNAEFLISRIGCPRSFNLVIERLLISGYRARDRDNGAWGVSISLSSGFSFQEKLTDIYPENALAVSISLSSGFSFQVNPVKHGTILLHCFNLVIERLLISGNSSISAQDCKNSKVSISLSSGFSFQVEHCPFSLGVGMRFNLVIERLLISGSQATLHDRQQ